MFTKNERPDAKALPKKETKRTRSRFNVKKGSARLKRNTNREIYPYI